MCRIKVYRGNGTSEMYSYVWRCIENTWSDSELSAVKVEGCKDTQGAHKASVDTWIVLAAPTSIGFVSTGCYEELC